jgi:hypothetical protein
MGNQPKTRKTHEQKLCCVCKAADISHRDRSVIHIYKIPSLWPKKNGLYWRMSPRCRCRCRFGLGFKRCTLVQLLEGIVHGWLLNIMSTMFALWSITIMQHKYTPKAPTDFQVNLVKRIKFERHHCRNIPLHYIHCLYLKIWLAGWLIHFTACQPNNGYMVGGSQRTTFPGTHPVVDVT